MPNHYHLLVQTLDPTLSAGMRQLNGDYTQAYNISHQRAGHLLQGRFKAMIIEEGTYLYRVLRYIILNPVRAGLVNYPLEWEWSSLAETIGKKRKVVSVDADRVLKYFDHTSKTKARKALMDYVGQKMEDDDPWKELRGRAILGSDSFVEKIRDYIADDKAIAEIPRQERFADRPDLPKLFTKAIMDNRQIRNDMIAKAYCEYGYSLSEIGRQLDLHYSAISKIVKRQEGKKS